MKDRDKSNWIVAAIGFGKLLKAAMLLFLALELHRLLNPTFGQTLRDLFHHLRIDPDNRHAHSLIVRLTGISPQTLRRLRLGSFLYAGLFATEGLGLVFRQKWAEYLTVVTTSLLLPLEVYELCHGRHQLIKAALLLANVAIVVYLIWRIRKSRARLAAGRGSLTRTASG